ncbi:ACP S-malonyltransferase [Paenibacillus sp. FSL M7-0420]|uniref:ACP S-malonyltransferase n=1 Tax=Paenibacillus sp. FSL M7-0420 TaxID=2921609 RepID=UPI0030FC4C56
MPKTVFVFPGLGSQYVGMVKSFYDQFEVARQTFEEASDILGYPLDKVCFEGSLSELSKPEIIQPALLTTNVAMFRAFMEEIGVRPSFSCGHSLGEYAALTCAGAIRFADAVAIVNKRGLITSALIQRSIGTMTILDQVNPRKFEKECSRISSEGRVVSISCYNSPNQVAISGEMDAVEEIEEICLNHDGQVTPLFMSAPMHSILMEKAALEFREELGKHTYYPFKWPVLSNVTGRPYAQPEQIADLLAKQMYMPVEWQSTISYLLKYGVNTSIEIGPKNVLSKLIGESNPNIKSLCYGTKEERQTIKELFNETGFCKTSPTVISKCLAAVAATPNKNWNVEEYNKGVVEPYRKLQFIQETLEKENAKPTVMQMREALNLLQLIFETKRVSEKERNDCIHHILDYTGNYYMLTEQKDAVLSKN